MDSDRWQRVDDLFHRAAPLTGAARAQFLAEACDGDDRLREEVESLLAFEPTSTAFIESPAADVVARLLIDQWSNESPSRTGTTIGQFRIGARIGQGGMGVVYEAEDMRLGRVVALKFLAPSVVSDPRAMQRLMNEARAASALNHPNICTIYSVHDGDLSPFIEMERLEGETLRERLARGRLDIDEAIVLTVQLLDALEAAHAKGLVHRDLKPANVFSTPRGAKILDFGIATLAPETDAGTVIGTAAYMSPEQAAGAVVDHRSDIFSLGAMLGDMLAGHRRVPTALNRIRDKAVDTDPGRRYQSAADMRGDLQRVQGRHARRLTLIAATIVLIALTCGVLLWRYGVPLPSDLFDANLRVRKIAHGAAEYGVTSGTISPDGTRVVFADVRGIHLLNPDTGETRRIDGTERPPNSGSWDVRPGWLPDGTQFVANRLNGDASSQSSIWMSTTTGPPRLVREHARALSVSPDAAWIAFSTEGTRGSEDDVWVMQPDGSAARHIFTADKGTRVAGLSWSPDTNRIIYLRIDATGVPVALETRDLLGGAATEVLRADDHEILQGAIWLRDGRMLYSVGEPTGTSAGAMPCSHWQMRVDATGRAQEKARPLAGWLPQCVDALSVSADSKRALYLQSAMEDAIHVVDVDASGARVQARRLTFTEGRNIPSGWARDGSFVFAADSLGRAALFAQHLGTDTPRLITDAAGIMGAARPTYDGSAVLFIVAPAGFRSRPPRLMRVPIEGGEEPQAVTSGQFVNGGARCSVQPAQLCAIAERSDDGKALIFTAVNPVGGRAHELTRVDITGFADVRWDLSPDGTRIAVLDARGTQIRIVLIDGPAAEQITLHGQHGLGYVSFTSDSRGVIVPNVTEKSANLLSVTLQGTIRVLWEQPGAIDISGLPSPDGRHIAVWIRARNASLWLADNP